MARHPTTHVCPWSARGVLGSSGCLNCGGDMCLKEAQARYARDVSFTGLKCQLCPWRDKARRGPRCTDRQAQPSHWPCLPVSHAPCGNMKPLSFPSSARFGSQLQLAANERTVGTRNKKKTERVECTRLYAWLAGAHEHDEKKNWAVGGLEFVRWRWTTKARNPRPLTNGHERAAGSDGGRRVVESARDTPFHQRPARSGSSTVTELV